MKITHVISDSNIGGAGVLISSIASELKNEFNIEVIIPTGSLLKKRLVNCGVKVTELSFCSDRSFCAKDTLKFYNYFIHNKPDILHTHASLSSRLGGKLSGINICISTRHCAIPEEKVSKKAFLKRIIYNYCTDMTVSTADFATKNLLCEGVSEKNITTIKNGSYKKDIPSAQYKKQLLAELGIKEDTKIIGSSARLEAIKGQDLILRAAPYIIKEAPDVHFLFLGEGSMKAKYKKLASALGIESKVTFLGYVENPHVYQNLFYINVNASRGTETSCLATSECMALGIPTVASDFGGNTEMIRNYENGIIFGSDNHFLLARSVISVLKDEALYKKLSDGALKSFDECFCAKKMAEKYKKLYLSFS